MTPNFSPSAMGVPIVWGSAEAVSAAAEAMKAVVNSILSFVVWFRVLKIID